MVHLPLALSAICVPALLFISYVFPVLWRCSWPGSKTVSQESHFRHRLSKRSMGTPEAYNDWHFPSVSLALGWCNGHEVIPIWYPGCRRPGNYCRVSIAHANGFPPFFASVAQSFKESHSHFSAFADPRTLPTASIARQSFRAHTTGHCEPFSANNAPWFHRRS